MLYTFLVHNVAFGTHNKPFDNKAVASKADLAEPNQGYDVIYERTPFPLSF